MGKTLMTGKIRKNNLKGLNHFLIDIGKRTFYDNEFHGVVTYNR